MNDYAYFIMHYKKNIERRNYIFEKFNMNNKTIHWITDFDREAISDHIDEVYHFNYDNWVKVVGSQLHLLIGHRLGLSQNRPWQFIIGEIENLLKQVDVSKAISFFPQFMPRKLKIFEISLLMKHRAVYQKIIDNDYRFGIVLEDDFVLKENSDAALQNIINSTINWDYIDIAGGTGLTPREQDPEISPGLFLVDPPRTRTTCGYLISNRLCKEIVNLNMPLTAPCDWELTYFMQLFSAKAFWTMPTLILHGSEINLYQSNNN